MTSRPPNAQTLKGVIANRAEAAKEPTPIQSLITDMERFTPQIERALPKSMKPDADRLTRIAITAVRNNDKLALCSPLSIMGALMTCAQLGLDPGFGGKAFLAPDWNSELGRHECTFLLGYHGAIELFYRHPNARRLAARPVKDNDFLDYKYGTEGRDYLEHKPAATDRGSAYAWYAVAAYRDGGGGFEVLYREDVEYRRSFSPDPHGYMWTRFYDRMARKSAFRELFTWLPTSRDLELAMAHDGRVRTELDPAALAHIDENPNTADRAEEIAEDPADTAAAPAPAEALVGV